MPFISKNHTGPVPVDTRAVTHSIGMVIYPWRYPDVVEGISPDIEKRNREESDPIFIGAATGVETDTPSGIIHMNIVKNKNISSTLIVDFKGTVNRQATIPGIWVVVVSSATRNVRDIVRSEGIPALYEKDDVIIRFIGQVHSVNGSFFADADGNLRKVCKVTFKCWSSFLHTPVRFHPSSIFANLEEAGNAQTISTALRKVWEDGEAVKNLISEAHNVFYKPFLLLYLINGLSLISSDTVTQIEKELSMKANSLDIFGKAISRLPVIPATLVKHVFNSEEQYSDESVWSKIFVRLISGVEKWDVLRTKGLYDDGIDKVLGTIGKLADKRIQTDEWVLSASNVVKRPISFLMTKELITGSSLAELLKTVCADAAACEFYADMWFYRAEDGKVRPQPVIVVRDMPYSLKKLDKGTAAWTYYDDLPAQVLDPSTIISINLKQGLEMTANLISFNPRLHTYASMLENGEIIRYGTMAYWQNQSRFGGKLLGQSVSDILTYVYAETGKVKSTTVPKKTVSDYLRDIGNIQTKFESDRTYSWFSELQAKYQEWYADNYKYCSGSMLLKDANYRLTVGHNIEFKLGPDSPIYVAHVEAVDQRYTVVEGGWVKSDVYVYFSFLTARNPLDPSSLTRLPIGIAGDLFSLTVDALREFTDASENLNISSYADVSLGKLSESLKKDFNVESLDFSRSSGFLAKTSTSTTPKVIRSQTNPSSQIQKDLENNAEEEIKRFLTNIEYVQYSSYNEELKAKYKVSYVALISLAINQAMNYFMVTKSLPSKSTELAAQEALYSRIRARFSSMVKMSEIEKDAKRRLGR